jgi:hypothetical protein
MLCCAPHATFTQARENGKTMGRGNSFASERSRRANVDAATKLHHPPTHPHPLTHTHPPTPTHPPTHTQTHTHTHAHTHAT